MKIFVICPVRGGVPPEVEAWVKDLESAGHKVHFPPRDTDQDDVTGYGICKQNMEAIKASDAVHIWYEPSSEGGHFDRGMAFVLDKKIFFINDAQVGPSVGKSFPNMIRRWALKL